MKRFAFYLLPLFVCAFVQAQSVSVEKTTFVTKAASIFQLSAVTAMNTKSGTTLVVWEQITATTTPSSHQILARLVGKKGNPISPILTLAAGPTVSHPAIAFNPAKSEFLLAYDDNPNLNLLQSSVYLQRLDPAGHISGTTVKITTDSISTTMANFIPRIVFNPFNSEYTLVWVREAINNTQSATGNNGLVGVVLASTSALSGNIFVLHKTVEDGTSLWSPIPQEIAYHTSGKLLLAYSQVQTGSSATKLNYFFGKLNADLTGTTDSDFKKINVNPVTINSSFPSAVRLVLQSTGAGFIIFADSTNVKKRNLDTGANLVGAPVKAFAPPKSNTKLLFPVVATSNGPSGQLSLLFAVEGAFDTGGQAKVWSQVLSNTGDPIGAATQVDSTTSADTALSLSLSALPPGAGPYKFLGLYSLTGFHAPGLTFDSAGIISLKATINH
ncbi:MAG: hypothetical protein C5B54_12125 [Acidobacteria bacterium]|nr:MAG: hypothetical protein C5B54_12125 [Acidobacteriota bacterium]